MTRPPSTPGSGTATPHLRRVPSATQLVVDGVPRLLLGGQVHSSTSSSPPAFARACDHLAAMHVTTVVSSAA